MSLCSLTQGYELYRWLPHHHHQRWRKIFLAHGCIVGQNATRLFIIFTAFFFSICEFGFFLLRRRNLMNQTSFLGYNGVSMRSVLPEAAQSVNLEKASPPLGSLQTTTAQTWWAWRRTRRSWANWWRPRLLRWDNSWTSILAFGHW